jgi:hypothetical protein
MTCRGRLQAAEVIILQSVIHQPPTFDVIIHNQVFYMNICKEQSVVFRQHMEEFTKEYTLYLQSADIVKPGQNWQPAAED